MKKETKKEKSLRFLTFIETRDNFNILEKSGNSNKFKSQPSKNYKKEPSFYLNLDLINKKCLLYFE